MKQEHSRAFRTVEEKNREVLVLAWEEEGSDTWGCREQVLSARIREVVVCPGWSSMHGDSWESECLGFVLDAMGGADGELWRNGDIVCLHMPVLLVAAGADLMPYVKVCFMASVVPELLPSFQELLLLLLCCCCCCVLVLLEDAAAAAAAFATVSLILLPAGPCPCQL